jgi:hypothetical protein
MSVASRMASSQKRAGGGGVTYAKLKHISSVVRTPEVTVRLEVLLKVQRVITRSPAAKVTGRS